MNIAIIYESATGNTAKVAEAIRSACGAENVIAFGGPTDVSAADLVFVGYWVDKGLCSDGMAAFCKGLSGKKVAIFGTAGAASEAYFQRLEERMRELLPAGAAVQGAFYCQGKMSDDIRAGYLAKLKEEPDNERVKTSLANFEKALTHPDEADLAAAGQFARRMAEQARG